MEDTGYDLYTNSKGQLVGRKRGLDPKEYEGLTPVKKEEPTIDTGSYAGMLDKLESVPEKTSDYVSSLDNHGSGIGAYTTENAPGLNYSEYDRTMDSHGIGAGTYVSDNDPGLDYSEYDRLMDGHGIGSSESVTANAPGLDYSEYDRMLDGHGIGSSESVIANAPGLDYSEYDRMLDGHGINAHGVWNEVYKTDNQEEIAIINEVRSPEITKINDQLVLSKIQNKDALLSLLNIRYRDTRFLLGTSNREYKSQMEKLGKKYAVDFKFIKAAIESGRDIPGLEDVLGSYAEDLDSIFYQPVLYNPETNEPIINPVTNEPYTANASLEELRQLVLANQANLSENGITK